MKRVVIAKISSSDSDEFQRIERIINTFQTMSHNYFLTEEEKENVKEELQTHLLEAGRFYKRLEQAYSLPQLNGLVYKLNPETSELFVEVN